MANLKYGSTGDDVKKLQNALIDAGYDVGSTGADGVFGKNTQAAVKAYQQANGLAVDGIAGQNTLGALYGTSTTSTTPATTTTTPATTAKTETSTTPTTTVGGFTYNDFTYEDYAPSDVVNQANQMLQQHEANKPGSYSPVWQDEADAYLSQYQNRGPFSYDFNSDALYNQYKDNYIRQGQMAMMDTMGQAAAMTGGYGNSYAQSVGQQTYNQYLGQLNEVLPELYQMAQNRYDQEGQEMLAMYDLYMDKENQAYGQYQDNLDNWYRESDRLTENYNTLYERDYGQYEDKKALAYDKHLADKDMAWDEYLKGLEKDETAANLLASAGSYDRLQEIYGLTDEEVAAIKKANTKSGGSKGSTYTKLVYGSEEYDRIVKSISGAKDLDDLEDKTLDIIKYGGYNPDDIRGLSVFENTKTALTPKTNPLWTGVPTGTKEVEPSKTAWELEQERRKQLGNSGGVTGLIK